MNSARAQVRGELRRYMSRTGLGMGQVAELAGYSTRTVIQFVSGGRFGDGDRAGDGTAETLRHMMAENPPAPPELHGRFYPTAATRAMDELIEECADGVWGICRGPSGSQKSENLRRHALEAWADAEPRFALVEGQARMTPRQLLAEIARAIAAPYAQATAALRQSIFFTARRRRTRFCIAIDEADLLYHQVDTLETLRRLGDGLDGRAGILIVGNEPVMGLFEDRRRIKVSFERWRSRVLQRRLDVLGPSREEARRMAAGELGIAPERVPDSTLDGCTVADPISGRKYVNVRSLFLAIRRAQRRRRRLQ